MYLDTLIPYRRLIMEAVNNCKCITKLMLIGKVKEYDNEIISNYASQDIEKGKLCLISELVEDMSDYDYEKNEWINNFFKYYELYPIDYCPICGKKIEYNKTHGLKLK